MIEGIKDTDINDLWKHHARECVRIAWVNKQLEHSSPTLLDTAAKHAAIARCIYEHGWLAFEKA